MRRLDFELVSSVISIHALREEGDLLAGLFRVGFPISIHALREEGDWAVRRSCYSHRDFYPRPPRGGRRPYDPRQQTPEGISIHALREEGDSVNRHPVQSY